MAILTIVDRNQVFSKKEDIQDHLAPTGIEYDRWEILPGIDKSSSSEFILESYAEHIERVKEKGGYAKADVVNVNAVTPGLDAMLARFSTEHWHDEEEVRFIVYGRGVYHVHLTNDGSVSKLEVEAGDMIRVPRGTLHWFDLCSEREIKAIRFFQDAAGWTPYYTESGLEKQYEPVCFGLTYLAAEKVAGIAWPVLK
ncbi:MAG TPA: cupin domain-containing protein [Bryobacteraceae bacterium]|nr:cupin domain-containing protein [Bryobacteraceae bacterium]